MNLSRKLLFSNNNFNNYRNVRSILYNSGNNSTSKINNNSILKCSISSLSSPPPLTFNVQLRNNNNYNHSIIGVGHLIQVDVCKYRRQYATHKSYNSESNKKLNDSANQNKRPLLGNHHVAIFFITIVVLVGSIAYVYQDMIFENRLYGRIIEELRMDPNIVEIFGEDFSAKQFYRDHHDEAKLAQIQKKQKKQKRNKQQNENEDEEEMDQQIKLNFNIFGKRGKGGRGSVRCRAKRTSAYGFEIISLKVKHGIKWITVVDRFERKPKVQTTLTKFMSIFKNRL